MTTAQHTARIPIPWTDVDLANLRRDVAAGLSNREIAERLSNRGITRTVESVKQQCKRQGLTAEAPRKCKQVSKWTEARDTWLRELVAAGLNDTQIADTMDDRAQTVQHRREQLRLRLVRLPKVNVTLPPKPTPPRNPPPPDHRHHAPRCAGDAWVGVGRHGNGLWARTRIHQHEPRRRCGVC